MTFAGRKYSLVEKQISISTYKYRYHKRSEKLVNFRSSHLIGFLKSMIKLLKKYL